MSASSYSPTFVPGLNRCARLVKRLMTPLKPAPAPIGISTGTTFVVSRSLIERYAASKSACSRSIVATTNSTGSLRAIASRNIRSVPASTPVLAPTARSAPSAAASPAMASPWKSRNPGVSRRLIFVSFHSAYAQPERDRVLALGFLGGGVGERRAVLDGAVSLAGPGDEGEGVDEGGLAARAVSDDGDVADGFAAVFAHEFSWLLSGPWRVAQRARQVGQSTSGRTTCRLPSGTHKGAANVGRPFSPVDGQESDEDRLLVVFSVDGEPIRFAEGGEQRLAGKSRAGSGRGE